MTRMPGATWRPVKNFHANGVKEHRGLVLHVQAGNNSPFGWFNNPASQASSDFWVGKDGTIEQYVNTGTDYAWAQAAGNPYYASVETEGQPGEPLTAAQVEGVAKIYAWGHKTFSWPLTVVDSTTAHGLTYHGVGGSAWGGHTGCPGDKRKAQRSAIIARAKQLVEPPAPAAKKYEPFPGAAFFKTGRKSPIIAAMHKRLVAVGCNHYQSSANADVWGSGDEASYAAWQRHLGYRDGDADGIPGKTSWDKLKVPNS
jgi:hypothetical protein